MSELTDEMELRELLGVRDFVEDALEDAGAEVTDSGLGRGYADVGFAFEGKVYAIKIVEREARPSTTP